MTHGFEESPRLNALHSSPPRTIVAIPAKNEVERIGQCLAALAMQRDACGAPLPSDAFETLILANDCADSTVKAVEDSASCLAQNVRVRHERSPPDQASAGYARRRAMDWARDRIRASGLEDGFILTTDADSSVSPTWIAETWAAFQRGVDCVAGYVDAYPPEIVSLGPVFLRRARLEDHYLRRIAEIYAICDPVLHDPWPNHRVASGASLAIKMSAYEAIGGLPIVAVGEDAALIEALARAGFPIRHSMNVQVYTSCRFDGRAKGGAADTMRLRYLDAEAPCDPDIEPALSVLRRARLRRRIRHATGAPEISEAEIARQTPAALQRATASRLRPSDLPAQIRKADRLLRRLRKCAGASALRRARSTTLGAALHDSEIRLAE